MKRTTSKLTSAFVVLLLLAAAAATSASSQTRRKVTPVDEKASAERAKAIEDSKNVGTEPDANEIRCRGGGFYLETVGSRIASSGETILTIALHSNYTLTWVDREILPGGQVIHEHWNFNPSSCAWVQSGDRGPYRPLYPEEPRVIRFETPANAQLRQQLHGTPVDTSPTAAERYPDAQTIPVYLQDPNHYWSFFVASTNRDFFQASGHKYFKPGLEVVRPFDERINEKSPFVFTPKKPE